MSRIGKTPITIPEGVTVNFEKHKISVTGPKGSLEAEIRPEISARIEEGELFFEIRRNSKNSSAFWGLTRALVNNMILGVVEGYEKKMELVGVGYRLKLDNPTQLTFAIGYSHPVVFKLPEGIEVELEDDKTFTVKGIDKQLVGQVAANIRKIRKPEPYKGKGIKYADEIIKRKPGKAGAV